MVRGLKRKVAPCAFKGPMGQLLNQKFSEVEENIKNVILSWENIYFVAKSGGDFSTIQGAIDKITDATVDNPWTILVCPGTYAEVLTLKDNVHVIALGDYGSVIVASETADAVVIADCVVYGIKFSQSGVPVETTVIIPCTASASIERDTPNTNYHNTSSEVPDYIGIKDTISSGIFGFNTAIIPSTAIITSATLYGYVVEDPSNPGYSGSAYIQNCLRNDFVDGQATWEEYKTGTLWTIHGANGDGTDYINDHTHTFVGPAGSSLPGWGSGLCTSIIQYAITNGYTNLKLDQHSSMGRDVFISADETANEPYLSVVYTPNIMEIVSSGVDGKTCTFSKCGFTGTTTYTRAVRLIGDSTINLFDCTFGTLKHCVENVGPGTINLFRSVCDADNNHTVNSLTGSINSYWNNYIGSGTHLVQSAGTLYTLADSFTTSSGTITLLGDVDKVDGYHASDFEMAVSAGILTDYYRGDKTWATLNTDAVAEGTNLYYTEARVNGNTNVSANTTHRSSSGVDHTYIDQDLRIAANVQFAQCRAAHYSSDNTAGSTGDITLATTTTINVKDGLIVGWS